MAEAQHDFPSVDAIDAESLGTPGKRTFRIRMMRGTNSAALWMEKQQLAALGEALPRLLEQLNTPDQHPHEEGDSIVAFPSDPTIDFKVGRMALGYAIQEDRVVLVAHDVEAGEDETIPPVLSCRFSREQARSLSEACAEAVEGGRPLCHLCHRPIDPEGHMCPRSNGHQKLTPQSGGDA